MTGLKLGIEAISYTFWPYNDGLMENLAVTTATHPKRWHKNLFTTLAVQSSWKNPHNMA